MLQPIKCEVDQMKGVTMKYIERLEAFWAGEKPDRIPYTIYQNE